MVLVRRSKQRAVARGRITDGRDPSRVLAYATIAYRMIEPEGEYMPGDRRAAEPEAGPPTASPEPILDAMAMRVRPDEGVCELDEVHAGVLAPEGRLHGGAHQLMHEAAGLAAARRALRTDAVRVGDLAIRFLAPAMAGPFVATASVVAGSDDEVLCQVDLVDRGGGDDVRSLSSMRVVRAL